MVRNLKMEIRKSFRQIALEAAQHLPEIKEGMAWVSRTHGTFLTFNSANGTFRDLLSVFASPGAESAQSLVSLGYNNLWFALVKTLNLKGDTQIKNLFVPVLAEALTVSTRSFMPDTKANLEKSDLARIMDIANRARIKGDLSPECTGAINKLMKVSARRFSEQCKAGS